MSTNNDCPVCNGRKIILTRDYQDCERDEPCPHCSEHENCASCITLRAENARLREAVATAKELIGVQPAHDDITGELGWWNEVWDLLDAAALTPPEGAPKEGGE